MFVQLVTPFVKLGEWIPSVHSRRELALQNKQLRSENDMLRQQLRALSETGRQNLRLLQLLNFKEHAGLRTIGARVISRDASSWWKSVQIDRGSQDGVGENMAVVNADGLVGRTMAVTKGESRVLLLLDPKCQVSALLQDSREHGIAGGAQTPILHRPRCEMTFVNRQVAVKKGEAVISSGFGGVFPKGLLVGHVEQARVNPETGMYQEIEIVPAVDFLRLEEVLVIIP